jgi:hypothetical protein
MTELVNEYILDLLTSKHIRKLASFDGGYFLSHIK